MLVVGGVPTGIWSRVSLERPGGAVAVAGSPPAPLIDSDPPPLHGSPVIGLVPAALPPIAAVDPGKVPGLIGETGCSGVCCTVYGRLGFCATTSRAGNLGCAARATMAARASARA